MKILVGTTETQGRRKNDFCYTKEGEVLCFHLECDGETVDGSCGCKRSMSGVDTNKATGIVVETTVRRILYFGFRLNNRASKKFVKENVF